MCWLRCWQSGGEGLAPEWTHNVLCCHLLTLFFLLSDLSMAASFLVNPWAAIHPPLNKPTSVCNDTFLVLFTSMVWISHSSFPNLNNFLSSLNWGDTTGPQQARPWIAGDCMLRREGGCKGSMGICVLHLREGKGGKTLPPACNKLC